MQDGKRGGQTTGRAATKTQSAELVGRILETAKPGPIRSAAERAALALQLPGASRPEQDRLWERLHAERVDFFPAPRAGGLLAALLFTAEVFARQSFRELSAKEADAMSSEKLLSAMAAAALAEEAGVVLRHRVHTASYADSGVTSDAEPSAEVVAAAHPRTGRVHAVQHGKRWETPTAAEVAARPSPVRVIVVD